MRQAFLAAFVLAGLALPAHAHTPLASSVPAAGSTVAPPVKEIVLVFNGQHANYSYFAPAGIPKEIAKKFTLAIGDELAPGDYVATWRAVGADTHVVSGEIKFSVAAPHSH